MANILRLKAPSALAPSRFHGLNLENSEKKGRVESFLNPHLRVKLDNGKAVRQGLALNKAGVNCAWPLNEMTCDGNTG